jgi:hypothetical protein
MATLDKKRRIVKNLTPELVNAMLAEGVLVRQGIDFTGMAHVSVSYAFDKGKKEFKSCRVEVMV